MPGIAVDYTKEAANLLKHLRNRNNFHDNCCFICAIPVSRDKPEHDPNKRQNEDVIPKWIQKRFGVARQRVTITNGTHAWVNQILTPACPSCNNRHLSQIEKVVADFVDGKLESIDRYYLDMWLMKVFFGLRYREMNFQDFMNRGTNVLSPDTADLLAIYRLLLNSFRLKVSYTSRIGFFWRRA